MARKDNATIVTVGAHFAALLGTWHGMRLDPLGSGQPGGIPAKLFIGGGCVGGVEPALAPEITVDLFGFDPLLDPFERRFADLAQGAGALGAELGGQRLVRGLDRGADLPAIAGAAPMPRRACIQNHRLATAPRAFDSGIQAGVTRPHDHHIRPRRELRRRMGVFGKTLKPIGAVLPARAPEAIPGHVSKIIFHKARPQAIVVPSGQGPELKA